MGNSMRPPSQFIKQKKKVICVCGKLGEQIEDNTLYGRLNSKSASPHSRNTIEGLVVSEGE